MKEAELIQAYKDAYITGPELPTLSQEQIEQRSVTFFRLSCELEDLGVNVAEIDRELDPGD